jgi:hypothetical protein
MSRLSSLSLRGKNRRSRNDKLGAAETTKLGAAETKCAASPGGTA